MKQRVCSRKWVLRPQSHSPEESTVHGFFWIVPEWQLLKHQSVRLQSRHNNNFIFNEKTQREGKEILGYFCPLMGPAADTGSRGQTCLHRCALVLCRHAHTHTHTLTLTHALVRKPMCQTTWWATFFTFISQAHKFPPVLPTGEDHSCTNTHKASCFHLCVLKKIHQPASP